MRAGTARSQGFTLIELSIVLVIIGLIVGGVLVGRDLIAAAAVRAQLSQIESYNAAANTFRGKFNYLPGDIRPYEAGQFGFPNANCDGAAARRNGDGQVQGQGTAPYYIKQAGGEPGLFWSDLGSTAAGKLIDVTLTTATCTGQPTVPSTQYDLYWPRGKLMDGAYVIVYFDWAYTNSTMFGLSRITSVTTGNYTSSYVATPRQAFSMDSKTDDGKPLFGRVQAFMVYGTGISSAAMGGSGCGANPDAYNTDPDYINSVNCYLSFRMN